MTMKALVASALSFATAIFAVLAAAFWIISTKVEDKASSNSTPGSGLDGYLVALNPQGAPVHLIGTLRKQWLWSSRAAWSAAAAALFQSIQVLTSLYL
jgi:hypothetical protein